MVSMAQYRCANTTQYNRCDTKGPQLYMLLDGTLSQIRDLARLRGWRWTSVSCSVCKHPDYRPLKKEEPRAALVKGHH